MKMSPEMKIVPMMNKSLKINRVPEMKAMQNAKVEMYIYMYMYTVSSVNYELTFKT
jgi:hypothetical protein